MHYNTLFELLYSSIPESVKESIINSIPEDILLEELSESANSYKPILEVLDILAYSENITEEKANSIIDEIFSNMDEATVEEILQAFIKEKVAEYIQEAIGHGTDSIGLAGLRREESDRNQVKHDNDVKQRAQNIADIRTKRKIADTISKVRTARDNAITGARQATEKAISKGTELKNKAISKGTELKNKLDNKVGEVKSKATTGIKNAVGRIKDWANKATEPTAQDYARAIGKKAIENEKAGKSNFEPHVKPGSYADRYAKSLKKDENKYDKTSSTNSNVKGTTSSASTGSTKNTTSSNTNPIKNNSKSNKSTTEKQPEVNTTEQTKTKKDKPVTTAKKASKSEEDVGDRIHREVTDTIKKMDVEKKEREAKEHKEVQGRQKRFQDMINGAHKGKSKKAEKTNAEKQPEVNKPTEVNTDKQPEVNKKEETSKESNVRQMSPNLQRAFKNLDREKNKQREDRINKLKRDIDLYSKEIVSAEGNPSKVARLGDIRKQKQEAEKKLQELQTNEALSDLAYFLIKTNISEGAFVEIMKMINSAKS